ncbi:MAG: lipopolysaccharide kinase InaA family protein [Gilvibacter sp.]
MKLVVQGEYAKHYEAIVAMLRGFDSTGELFGDGERNVIKLFELNGTKVNVKRFKNPNLINAFAYKFVRSSKAERSYTFGQKLLSLGIGTPTPIAYAENSSAIGFKDSYYVSEHLDCDLTYRELVHEPDYPDHENILRAFTRFTYKLHEAGVLFKDHSPGNTLIKKTQEGYAFYLVDLNRMTFKTLSIEERIANFARLSPKEEMVAVMSDEYAKIVGLPYDQIFTPMWGLVQKFQTKYHRKVRLKKKYLFWRK